MDVFSRLILYPEEYGIGIAIENIRIRDHSRKDYVLCYPANPDPYELTEYIYALNAMCPQAIVLRPAGSAYRTKTVHFINPFKLYYCGTQKNICRHYACRQSKICIPDRPHLRQNCLTMRFKDGLYTARQEAKVYPAITEELICFFSRSSSTSATITTTKATIAAGIPVGNTPASPTLIRM